MLALVAITAAAQEESRFLFPGYQATKVIFKDGTIYNEKMNYNLLEDRLYFIDHKSGEEQVLTNPQDISVLNMNGRLFTFIKGHLVEVVNKAPMLYAKYEPVIKKDSHHGAYGMVSETTAIHSVGGVYVGDGKLVMMDNNDVHIRAVTSSYYVEIKGKIKQFSNVNQLKKLYPAHAGEIKKYMSDNHVDFADTDAMAKLVTYVASL